MNTTSLKDQLLIAMPSLSSGFFSHSAIYLCEHDEHGAMGITLNKPMEFELEHVLSQLDIPCSHRVGHLPVLSGGPVQSEHGFILHSLERGTFDSTLIVTDNIGLTTSIDIMHAIGEERGPARFVLALGYAGWGEGQLEQELLENSWLTAPATSSLIFDTPSSDLVRVAAGQLGFDMNLMPSGAGHA
jgi:putative transcriptional regulator